MASPIIRFKRGLFTNLPDLLSGEPGFTTDKYDFYIGTDETGVGSQSNEFFGSGRYWLREDGVDSLRLRLVASDGDVANSIQIKTPNSHTGTTIYTLPSTPTDGYYLRTNSSGVLSWVSIEDNSEFNTATINNSTINNSNINGSTINNGTYTGVSTFSSGSLNVDVNSDFSGLTVFSNTTDNTLGNPDTGAVQIDGGLGVELNATIGASLYVGNILIVPEVRTDTISHSNSTNAITIDASGNLLALQNLTVSGDFFVNGNSTFVNTEELTVYDRTITLGIETGGVHPTDTTWDLGVMMAYSETGLAKTSGMIWESSNKRFQFASETNNPDGVDSSSPQIVVSSFAPIEVGELLINNSCTGGTSQVIYCDGTDLTLDNILIDGGSY